MQHGKGQSRRPEGRGFDLLTDLISVSPTYKSSPSSASVKNRKWAGLVTIYYPI